MISFREAKCLVFWNPVRLLGSLATKRLVSFFSSLVLPSSTLLPFSYPKKKPRATRRPSPSSPRQDRPSLLSPELYLRRCLSWYDLSRIPTRSFILFCSGCPLPDFGTLAPASPGAHGPSLAQVHTHPLVSQISHSVVQITSWSSPLPVR